MSLLLYYKRERDTGRVTNNVTVIILSEERDTGRVTNNVTVIIL